jgi:hypothetical protein
MRNKSKVSGKKGVSIRKKGATGKKLFNVAGVKKKKVKSVAA